MEIESFQEAAELLAGATELLDRWGFVHYLDRQHRRLLDILDPQAATSVLHNFGILLQSRGDYEQALEYYQRSLEIKEELDNRAGVASSLHQIGTIQQLRGDYDQALHYYQRSIEIAEELGHRAVVATSLQNIGRIHHFHGDYEQALQYFQRSLEIADELDHRAGMASSLHNIGIIQQLRGDNEQALQYYRRSLKIEEELGNRAGVAESRCQIGKLLTDSSRYAEAFEHLVPALSTFMDLHSPTANIVWNNLKTLRGKWGDQNFDAAWKNATETGVPDWLKS
jgi:tetratricopeptide (TPR) repeat protein